MSKAFSLQYLYLLMINLILVSCISKISVDKFSNNNKNELERSGSELNVQISSNEKSYITSTTMILNINFTTEVKEFTTSNLEITNGTIEGITKINDKNFLVEIELNPNSDIEVWISENQVESISGKYNNRSNVFSISQVNSKTKVTFKNYLRSVSDSSGSIQFELELDKTHDKDIQVGYLVSGSGVFGMDHDAQSGTITIPQGQTTQTIDVTLYDKVGIDKDKSLNLSLYSLNEEDVEVGSNNISTVFIENDDPSIIRKYKDMFIYRKNICAININDKLICWGENQNGILGNGTEEPILRPTIIDGAENYRFYTTNGGLACAITTTDKLKCWGSAILGGFQGIGDGTTNETFTPTLVLGALNIKSVHMKGSSAYAITNDGDLYAWGLNPSNYLGDNSSANQYTPVLIDSGEKYKTMVTDNRNMCGITTNDDLKCWGRKNSGMVGDGTDTDVFLPKIIDPGVKYQQIHNSTGYSSRFCGLTTAGAIKCWGGNGSAMAAGDPSYSPTVVPTDVDPGEVYIDLAVGEFNNCGITILNKVKCWGSNWYGEQGNFNYVDSADPIEIDGNHEFKKIYAGGFDYFDYYYCGITLTDDLYCWGSNDYNQRGVGPEKYGAESMDQVAPGTKFKKAFLSNTYYDMFSCALTSDDHINCFGEVGKNVFPSKEVTMNLVEIPLPTTLSTNQFNSDPNQKSCVKLADNSVTCFDDKVSSFIKLKTNNINFKKLKVFRSGTNKLWCGIDQSDKLSCWGKNQANILALNSAPDELELPTPIDPIQTYKDFVVLASNVCGITTSNKLRCWGANFTPNPDFVNSATNYTKMFHSTGDSLCVIRELDNELECFGYNSTGILGDGTSDYLSSFTRIDSGQGYFEVFLGSLFSCGITTTNQLKCWGRGYLGNGAYTTTEQLPTLIDGATSYKYLHINFHNTCGITIDDKLKCWGINTYGSVGNGSTSIAMSPTSIDSATDYKDVFTSRSRTCGITTSNNLKCWGENYFEALGPIQTRITTPTLVPYSKDLIQLEQNQTGICVRASDNTLHCNNYSTYENYAYPFKFPNF